MRSLMIIFIKSLVWSLWQFRFFYKIVKQMFPIYLQNYLNSSNYESMYFVQSATESKTKSLIARSKSFETFLNKWTKLSKKIKNIEYVNKFESIILIFIRTKVNLIFGICNINAVELVTCLKLNFIHLNEHKFCLNFNVMNLMCSFGSKNEPHISSWAQNVTPFLG